MDSFDVSSNSGKEKANWPEQFNGGKIVHAEVLVSSPGRNFVTIKVETDRGVYGLGDATLNGRELAVASYLTKYVIPNLLGRDAGRIEDIWQFLYRGAYWRRGPVTMRAIAAVDMALWDIKGKILDTPVHNLLGGRSRDRILVYGHANGHDIEQTIDEVVRYQEAGYKAVRAQTGIPGVKGAYGVGRGSMYYEPADAALPTNTVWSTSAYLDHATKLFDRLREKVGFELHVLHDVHHRLTPMEAAALGKAVEPYRLFWLEDLTPAENQEAFNLIRQHTTTPLAVGEVFNTIWDCKDLIQNQLIDYIRTTVLGAGGITHLRRIADFAAIWQVRTGCHGATDLSPITMSAALHFDVWAPNFGIQEYMRHTDDTWEVFTCDYTFDDGYLHIGDKPGLGVDIDEKAAARYPYKPKQLPVARLEDGTMWNW